MYLSHHFLIIQLLIIGFTKYGYAWSRSPEQTGKLKDLDVICGKDHMTVRAEFDGPFNGIVSSKGSWGQGNCVYIKSHSGVQHATFKVMYNECGTKPDLQGKYYENTVIFQYGTDIIEAMDEAKRLRCEWFEAYEKPATFRPAIPVADLDVVEMNFQGDDIDCFMEIQEGKGPYSKPVNRIVPVGHEMTIVIAISDQSNQFDMRVKSCFAHDGVKPPVQLTDEYGCVLRKSMLSEFKKIRGNEYRKNLGDNAIALNNYLSKSTVISYAHFYAFNFPDSLSVQLQCTVEVCRNGCPNACDVSNYPSPHTILKPKISFNQSPNRKNENRHGSQNRGNTRRNQNYDHSHDLVLDDDVALTAAESNQQASVLPLELQNHRRILEEDLTGKENQNILPAISSMSINTNSESVNDIKLNNDQIQQIITTTAKPIYKASEDALQHESSKLISELKFAGMDLNRINSLADNLLNNKQQPNMNPNSLTNKQIDQSILLDNLPSITSHIQRLQNDHLEKVLRDDKLRELALESGLKLNHLQLNELLPQAQPLKTNDNNSSLNHQIDFDSLLNSVNNLISSSTLATSTVPFVHTTSTTTTTQSPAITEFKDVYLEEETAPSDDVNVASVDDLNDAGNLKPTDQNQDKDQVNVRILNNHQLQANQLKHESLPKNQPAYIIESTPPKQVHKLNQAPNKQLHLNVNNVNNNKPVIQTHQPALQMNKNHQHPNNNNNKQPMNFQNGHILNSQNLIQPLINHQHHQPFHFQYIPTGLNSGFNSLPMNPLTPLNLNSLNSLNTLPINLLTSAQLSSQLQSPVVKPVKQTNKLANLFKQNSITQYVNTLFKKENGQSNSGLLSLFSPSTNRALRVGRNARMQIPNRLSLIKLKRDHPAEPGKIRLRRSTGSHVSVNSEFQVVTPLDMQFNDEDNLERHLNQPELLHGKSSLKIGQAKSLICLDFSSTLALAIVSASVLFIISVLVCIFMIKRFKKLELS